MQPFDSLAKLPIFEHREAILRSVDTNQVTIITAETGAGKSTQVPQYLAEHGYRKIIVTQPRILAARNLSQRVRQEYSWRLSRDSTDLVGYRTANERDDHPDNVILYCTDGLQLVRELTGSGTSERQVLVLDEIHEWNENMEVLVAWAKKRCQEDPLFTVVLMSATIEADQLAAYFGSGATIAVAGRSFGVTQHHGKDLIAEIIEQAKDQSRNMLVFLPGKAEIENVAEAIQRKIPSGVPIIPLHSQLEADEQQRAFDSYSHGKIILATNVAQTSITIDDIDVVIDSGLERRSEVRSGVEGLFISQISQADCLQRAGRAGRTKAGQYILAPLERMPCLPLEDRPAYGVPEIMRKHIDRLVLRLANIGIDIESLDFYHAPSNKTIKLAKRTLISLGALTATGTITAIGRRMERFPVESSYARMLVQAEDFSAETKAKLAAIIAIQEVGGIVKGSSRYTGWQQFSKQNQSDLIAQYDVFLALPTVSPDDHEELGIITKNAAKAEDVITRLNRDLGLVDIGLTPVNDEETDNLLMCIVAGQLHQIWSVQPNREVIHIGNRQSRELSSSSVVKHASLIAGTAFDLEITTPKGLETLHLVNDITAIEPTWLEELAPDRFEISPGKIYFDSSYGTLAARNLIRFDGNLIEIAGAPIVERTQKNQELFIRLYSAWLHEQIQKERRNLQLINFRRLPAVSLRQVENKVRQQAHGIVSLLELDKSQRIALHQLSRLESYLGRDFMAELNTPGQEHAHHRTHHRRWQPPHKRKFQRKRRER